MSMEWDQDWRGRHRDPGYVHRLMVEGGALPPVRMPVHTLEDIEQDTIGRPIHERLQIFMSSIAPIGEAMRDREDPLEEGSEIGRKDEAESLLSLGHLIRREASPPRELGMAEPQPIWAHSGPWKP